jgi:hypothetical protein
LEYINSAHPLSRFQSVVTGTSHWDLGDKEELGFESDACAREPKEGEARDLGRDGELRERTFVAIETSIHIPLARRRAEHDRTG